jgi:hypothetical protein
MHTIFQNETLTKSEIKIHYLLIKNILWIHKKSKIV